jgi:adenine phosphoribosyltransferase
MSSVEQELAAVIPYFPYKKLDRFYDVQGLLRHPALFQKACDTMAGRCKEMGITKVAGFEARGFLFTPVAVRLNVPFIMLRKTGKMPNTVSSAPYTKEYEGVGVTSHLTSLTHLHVTSLTPSPLCLSKAWTSCVCSGEPW